jgi:hypothetical protein
MFFNGVFGKCQFIIVWMPYVKVIQVLLIERCAAHYGILILPQ